MKRTKIKTQYPGVRYYEHTTRKMRNGQADRYFSVRYKINGTLVEEGLGWASEGWNAEKAHDVRAKVRKGITLGEGPASVADMRDEGEKRRKAAKEAERVNSLLTMSLESFFTTYYLPRAKKEKRSWLTDAQRIDKLINPALGAIPFRIITQQHVQDFVDKLSSKGAAASTVKQYMSIIRHAYNIATDTVIEGQRLFEGINPTKGVRLPKVCNARERFLTANEAEKIIAEAKKLRSPDLHDAIILSLNTGLRLGELRRLRWIDVDLAHGFVTVREEDKRKPGGKVPLNSEAKSVFEARSIVRSNTALVFPPICGTQLRENLTHEFRYLVDRLGLNADIAPEDRQNRIVFHSLRHTFASWLALAGTDIYRIKTLMRHKNITMTMRYAHLIPDATREAVHNLKPPKSF